MTCLIQEAAWRSTPPEIPGKDPISLTPPHIREIVTEKRRARNRWQRNRNPIDKRVYNQLTRQLKAALQDTRNATFETYINTLSKEDHTIWKATKQFNKPITHVPPILQEDGNWGKQTRKKLQPSLSTSPKYLPLRRQTTTITISIILSKHP